MNFIEVTNPYARQLEAWKNGHGSPDTKSLNELADIWQDFKMIPEYNKEIFMGSGNTNLVHTPKTDLACGPCVSEMLQMVTNWRNKFLSMPTPVNLDVPKAEVETVNFKGIKEHNIGISGEFKKGEGAELNIETKFGTLEIDLDPKEKEDIENPKTRLWRIRQIAKRIHIKFTPNFTKDEIIALIKQKIKEHREKR